MKQTLIDILFWTWISFAILDVVGGLLGWIELRTQDDATHRRLSKVMFAGAQRSFITCLGLSLFGLNVKAHWLFLVYGCWGVIYKAYATWGWLMYWRGLLTNGGFWSLMKKLTTRSPKPPEN